MKIAPGIEVDDAHLAAICGKYGIGELQIFGFRARGIMQPGSDMDILYTLRSSHRLGWEIDQFADELAELFGRPVDLVSPRALHPPLRPTVLTEARPLYAA